MKKNSIIKITILFAILIQFSNSQLPTNVTVKKFYDASKVSFKDIMTIRLEEVPSLPPKHFWVMDLAGRIYTFYPNSSGTYDKSSKQKIADYSYYCKTGGNYGSTGLAFHPKFPQVPKFYICYFRHPDPTNPNFQNKKPGIWKFEEWSASGPKFKILNFEREILSIPREWDTYGSANIVFGPDGYLYIAHMDYNTDSYDLSHFGRKILRIDIDRTEGSKAYAIPDDNPFINNSDTKVKKEIWAYGFRNAWNLYWDPLYGYLWASDVGQSKWEEVNIVQKGGNHGWADKGDGTSSSYGYGFNGYCLDTGRKNCDKYIDPEWAFSYPLVKGNNLSGVHAISIGVTYRADKSSVFYGYHIFSDIYSNKIFATKEGEKPQLIGNVTDVIPQLSSGNQGHNGLSHFSEDAYGNIYTLFVSPRTGERYELYKLSHTKLGPSPIPLDIKHKTSSFKKPGMKIMIRINGRGFTQMEKSGQFFRLNGIAISPSEMHQYSGLLIYYYQN